MISRETWDEMHSEPTTENELALGTLYRSTYTKGGIHLFGLKYMTIPKTQDSPFQEKCLSDFEFLQHEPKSGFYGWQGYGGSLFQYDPVLKIGFSYVPTDLFILDFCNHRGAKIQKIVKDIVSSK